jgi:hypothetical protein
MNRCTIITTILSSLTLCVSAQTTIVYTGIKNLVIPTNFDGIYLDIDTGNTGGPELAGLDINPFFGGLGIANTPNFLPVRTGTNQMDPYVNLVPGTVVNETLTFSSGDGGTDRAHIGATSSQFQASVAGYIGFEFTPNAGGGVRYGWMRLTLTPNTAGAIIHDWAFESTGEQIYVGMTAVPEPTSSLLFSLASAALLVRRRRN